MRNPHFAGRLSPPQTGRYYPQVSVGGLVGSLGQLQRRDFAKRRHHFGSVGRAHGSRRYLGRTIRWGKCEGWARMMRQETEGKQKGSGKGSKRAAVGERRPTLNSADDSRPATV